MGVNNPTCYCFSTTVAIYALLFQKKIFNLIKEIISNDMGNYFASVGSKCHTCTIFLDHANRNEDKTDPHITDLHYSYRRPLIMIFAV